MVQGTAPTLRSAPNAQGMSAATSAATKITVAVVAKWAMVAIIATTIVVGTIKVLPIITHPVTPPGNTTHTGTPVVTTVPMPPTQTSCPTAGTARAAVIRPLALGKHPAIVYDDDEGTQDAPISATLKRYDTTTGMTTQIVTLAGAATGSTQISPDRQWVLFTTKTNGQSVLQMVRMDGQGLQTLYCSSTGISQPYWSHDQKWIAFTYFVTSTAGLNESLVLVNTTNGTLLTQPFPQGSGDGLLTFTPIAWVDNTHLYCSGESLFLHHSIIDMYSLAISDQQHITFTKIPGMETTGDWIEANFTTNLDNTKLYTSIHTFGQGISTGPGSITVQPVQGGPLQTVYSNPNFAITEVYVATHSLLFVMDNSDLDPNSTRDFSQNGLWKINLDGSGLTRITTDTKGEHSDNASISGDGTMFAYSLYVSGGAQSLLLESMNGGTPITFVSTTNTSTSLSIVGWTTF